MKVYSFFSGLGFLDLGFEQTEGFEVSLINEYHRPFFEAYEHARSNMGHDCGDNVSLQCCSIEDLAGKRNLFKSVRSSTEPVGFIGGPPCPDFSIAGKQKGQHGDNGRLTRTYIELIRERKPDWFLFENVKGLWSTKKHKSFYDEMTADLVADGYCIDDRLINSIEYGAPQDRDRIILIGFHKRLLGKRSGGRLETGLDWLKFTTHDRDKSFNSPWPEVDDFGGSPIMPRGCPKELTVEHWFRKNKVKVHPNYGHGFKPRTATDRFTSIQEGDVSRKSFKRLHRWRYSPTVAYGNNEVHLHPYEPRRLRASEALALQTLPPAFALPEDMTLSNMFKGIGNGVPYLAGAGLASMIKDKLESL